jgi:hypothetical protein
MYVESLHEFVFEVSRLVAFSRWFLLKMIWLQSKPECTGLHKMCQKITVELLQIIKWRDLYCFSQLLTEIIHTMAGVSTIPLNLHGSSTHHTLCIKIKNYGEVIKKSSPDPLGHYHQKIHNRGRSSKNRLQKPLGQKVQNRGRSLKNPLQNHCARKYKIGGGH